MSKLSKDRVEKILRTLPIGYYLGKNYHVDLSDGATTSCDLMNEHIEISYPQIEKYYGDKELDDEALESRIRGLLYHELSHAMLTPKALKANFKRNVVEDCRIEKVCEGYYMGVDFMQLRREMMAETPTTDVYNAFLRFCKLRDIGTQELFDKLDRLLDRYADFNALTTQDECYYYGSDIEDLFNDFSDWYQDNNDSEDQEEQDDEDNEDGQSQGQGQGQGQSSPNSGMSNQDNSQGQSGSGAGDQSDEESSDEDGNSGASGSTGDEGDEEATGTSSSEGVDGESQDGDGDSSESEAVSCGRSSQKGILPQFKEINNAFENNDLLTKFMAIFSSSSKRTKMNSSAMNSYSGVFDPRSAGREDYKFFLQKNRQGSARAYSKVHLNLFLDRSGSFDSNVETANQIIFALCQCERKFPEFDFTLITCGVGETIEPKTNLQHSAWDGTEISSEIFETFKKVQKRDAVNYNVVLYDGRAYDKYAMKGADGYIGNFAAFNTSNTVLILDDDNRQVEDICPAAKVIISNDYVNKLIENLLSGLQKIFC